MNGMTFPFLFTWICSNTLSMFVSQATLNAKYLTIKRYIIYLLVVILGATINAFFPQTTYIFIFINTITMGILTKRIIMCTTLALIGYIISVVYNYVALTIFEYFTGFNQMTIISNIKLQWLFYLFFFPTLYLLLKLIGFIIDKLPKPHKSEYKPLGFALMSFLIICSFILIFNITYEYIKGFPKDIMSANLKLFLLFLLMISIVLFTIIVFVYKDARTNIALKEMEHLEKYTSELEEMYSTLRGFKHDYNNVLCSLKYYIDNKQYDELDTYYKKDIMPLINSLQENNFSIEQLSNIRFTPLKSILYFKMLEATQNQIKTTLEVKWPIDEINIKAIDLTRILGIFIDNAIDANTSIQDISKRYLNISCISSGQKKVIIINNPSVEETINLSSIQKIGVSSKGINRGYGLPNIYSILKKYDNVLMQTTYIEGCFTQTLEILD